MATKVKSRIRWTAEEINTVLTAARELHAKGTKLTSERRLARAQAALPKNRRRPYSANLGSWLSKAVRGAVDASPSAKGAGSVRSAKRGSNALVGAPATDLVSQALIATGAAILKGILLDPGVQKALKKALR